MLPVFTAYLVPAEYGRLEVVLALSSLCGLLIGFGLSEALYRYAGLASSQAERLGVLRNVFSLSLLLGVCFGLPLLVMAEYIAAWLPGQASALEVRLLLLSVTLEGCIGIPLAWLRMCDRASQFFWLTIGKVSVQALLTLYFLDSGLGVTGVLLAGALSALLLASWLLFDCWRQFGLGLEWRRIPELLSYGGPMMISGFAGFVLAGLDRFWLAAELGEAGMAPYALACKLALACGILMQPFALWWYPRRFTLLQEANGRQRAAQLAVLGSAWALLVSGAVGLVAPLLILWLTPSDYHQAIVLLPWLMLAMACKHLAELLNLGCYVDRNSQLQMHINLATALLAVFAYMLWIAPYGVLGALWAMLLCYALRLLLFFVLSQRRLYLPYRMLPLLLAALLAVLMVLGGQWLAAGPGL
jgi:O-antigen/teichoic acid export membrane protein